MKTIAITLILLIITLLSCKKEEKSSSAQPAGSQPIVTAKKPDLNQECPAAIQRILTKLKQEVPESQKEQFSRIEKQITTNINKECREDQWDLKCLKEAIDLQSMTVCKHK